MAPRVELEPCLDIDLLYHVLTAGGFHLEWSPEGHWMITDLGNRAIQNGSRLTEVTTPTGKVFFMGELPHAN
jgi:hypothetical protein